MVVLQAHITLPFIQLTKLLRQNLRLNLLEITLFLELVSNTQSVNQKSITLVKPMAILITGRMLTSVLLVTQELLENNKKFLIALLEQELVKLLLGLAKLTFTIYIKLSLIQPMSLKNLTLMKLGVLLD